jgi:MFS family permease
MDMFRDKTFVGVNLAVFLMMIGVGMIVAILPQKIMTLTGSGATVGYLASAFALSYIALQVPIGHFADKLGFKVFLVTGYVLCGVTGILFYYASSANLIFIGRLLQGVGEAPIWALAPALLSIRYPQRKGTVMGWYNATIHFGLTLGPLAGMILSKSLWATNQAFILYAGLCFAGAVVSLLSITTGEHANTMRPDTMNLKNIFRLAANREIFITFIGITLYGAGYGLCLTIIPAFLLQVKQYSPTAIGFYFFIFYIAISLAQLITGPLSDRIGRKIFMVIGLGVAAFGSVLFPNLRTPWINGILGIVSLGLGVFYLASMAFLNEHVTDSLKGTISGAYYLFWGVGMFFGPILVTKIGELSTPQRSFYVFSGALLSEAIALLLLSKKKEECKAYEH